MFLQMRRYGIFQRVSFQLIFIGLALLMTHFNATAKAGLFQPSFLSNDLAKIRSSFTLDADDLQGLATNMHKDVQAALEGQPSSLAMLHSFALRPKSYRAGRYIGLDLGGTNLRVEIIEVQDRQVNLLKVNHHTLPKELLTTSRVQFYDFIAKKVKEDIEKSDKSESYTIGFSFAFPVELQAINRGTLLRWTKNFAVRNMVGEDVVIPLEEALQRQGVANVEVVSLSNDTVGTLAYSTFRDPQTSMGIILGTGTNAAIWWNGEARNMEWGNFPDFQTGGRHLQTRYDAELDANSTNPTSQLLEKMVAGKYLGEILRQILLHGSSQMVPLPPYAIQAQDLASCAGDGSLNLHQVETVLERWGMPMGTLEDRKALQEIAGLILDRSAAIVAASIVGTLQMVDPKSQHKHSIGIDGSLYTKNEIYPVHLAQHLSTLLGKSWEQRVQVLTADDATGKGAAIIAAGTR